MRDLTPRIAQLSPPKRALLMRRLRQQAGGAAGAASDDARLVAYVVPEPGLTEPDPADLRAFLQLKLPDYMIPSAFVWLDALPRTSNGKVNREALPAPDRTTPGLEATFVAPRTPAEETLARLWSEVLGFNRIGVHDNFFEIGGDSILSIQIIAKARQAGLHLTPNQLFQYQTIAELAAVVDTGAKRPAEQEPVTGPAALTPIQHWFFEQPLTEPHHWNQTLWLEVPAGVDLAWLEEALREVVHHHDALRLRFVREDAGWQPFYAGPERPVPVAHIDLSALPEEKQGPAMAEAAATLQASMNLTEGPLMQVALFEGGGGRPARLLIAIHHLVVDLISWQILLEDLEAAYGQLSRGEAVRLPLKTSSFKAWSEVLTAYAQSDDLREESGLWLSLPEAGTPHLPRDASGPFTEASARTLAVSLSVAESRSLLQDVPAAYNTQAEDVLLTALVQSFMQWTGAASLLIGLERHGREEIAEGLDLSRTVGWFTSAFPVLLSLEAAPTPGVALKSIKEQLRQIPRQGIGYGLLRYLSRAADIAGKLQTLPQPEVLFNYAGRAGSPASGKGVFRPVQTLGISRSPSNRRAHLLEINAFIAEDQLTLNWTYSTNIHRQETLERLTRHYMEALRALMAHCLSPEAGGYTPSDFPEAGLSQEELDRFVGKLFS